MLSWDKVYMPKGMGVIGCKDLKLFNLSLLRRQLWRLVNHRDSLCYAVLSAKYFPEGDPFHSKRVDKPSYAWTSFYATTKELKGGFGWQVGDGSSININKHQWGFEGLDGNSLVPKYGGAN